MKEGCFHRLQRWKRGGERLRATLPHFEQEAHAPAAKRLAQEEAGKQDSQEKETRRQYLPYSLNGTRWRVTALI
jgi:anti-sigma factor RsiW